MQRYEDDRDSICTSVSSVMSTSQLARILEQHSDMESQSELFQEFLQEGKRNMALRPLRGIYLFAHKATSYKAMVELKGHIFFFAFSRVQTGSAFFVSLSISPN
jgi:hypothetical protein